MSRTGRNATATPETEAMTAAFADYRRRYGIGALAAVIEDALDLRAGPRALTEQERADRAACREQFGEYDPGSTVQMRWLRHRDEPAGHRSCTVEGCTKPHAAKGWCHTHYQRVRRTGSTAGRPIGRPPKAKAAA